MKTNAKSWVLITGASSGFGEEFARQYAEQGYAPVLVARRLDRLQAIAEEIGEQHRVEVVVEQVDVSHVAAVVQLHQRLRERDIAIDILINNAGHGLQGPFLGAQLDAALAMVQLDVASLTAVTHVFAQDMRTRGRGKILLVASLLAYQGVQNFAVYSAAKAYVLRLGEALHRELKRDGITVTTLCPGMSDTGFANAAQQKITPALKLLMMKPAPVVRAGIRALHAGRISVVPGLANKASVIFMWVTPRWLHQAVFSRVMNATPDRARIIAPPPLLALGCILLGFVARHFFPLRWFAPANTLPILVGVVMIAISIAVVVLAGRTFIAQGTHRNPYRPTKALVMTGVFSVSRNPIYVAFLLSVLAFALLANSLWFVIFACVLLLVLHFGVVKQEERYLREKFGDSYEQYCSRVRRWI
jgi:uncharacterized protein